MQIPPEIIYRNVEKTDAIAKLVQNKLDKLEKICDYIISTRVVIDRTNQSQRTANPHRVHIDIRVPPKHVIVVERICRVRTGEPEEPLDAVIRRAFDAAARELKSLVEKQRREVKKHADHRVTALVDKIFPNEGYGFLKALDGSGDIYFHRNSVLHGEWDRLIVGTGVRFAATMGEKGLQATSVEIVDKRGERLAEKI